MKSADFQKLQKKQRQGSLAQSYGSNFESQFQAACIQRYVACTRMPDGCKRVGVNKIIPVKTPFDWIISFDGRTALIDTKSTDGDSFPHSKITLHQVEDLRLHERAGTRSGYVILFRPTGTLAFVAASTLYSLYGTRGSVKETDTHTLTVLGRGRDVDVRLIFDTQKDPNGLEKSQPQPDQVRDGLTYLQGPERYEPGYLGGGPTPAPDDFLTGEGGLPGDEIEVGAGVRIKPRGRD